MAKKDGYGQYCPISVAAEVVAQKWTLLVIRGIYCGGARFNDIAKSVPRMSSALLSRRLKELEYAGIVDRVKLEGSNAVEYRLTDAGRELFPVLDTMGAWAQKWLRREIVKDDNLDPDVLMWELRHLNKKKSSPKERRVVSFQLSGVPITKRFYWLVFEPGDTEVCISDPGYEVDLWITAHIRTLIEIWLGHTTISRARSEEKLQLDGTSSEIDAFSDWFALSHFSKYGQESGKDI